MSELKAYYPYANRDGFYHKSEVDKFITDLEESHKKEVEQLLIEIVKLKADYMEACGRLQTANLIKDEQIAETRRQKYKRCLAMAMWCESKVYHIRRTPLCDMDEHEYWQYENDFWQRWQKRWLELAEKFKEE